jgi:hypothetical protein
MQKNSQKPGPQIEDKIIFLAYARCDPGYNLIILAPQDDHSMCIYFLGIPEQLRKYRQQSERD